MLLWLLLLIITSAAIAIGWLERATSGRSELAYVQMEGVVTSILLLDTRHSMPLRLAELDRLSNVVGGSTRNDLFWSPDGERLAFIQQNQSGSSDIVVIEIATRKRSARTIEGLGGRLAWSADGQRLAYSRFSIQRQWNIYGIEVATLSDDSLHTPPLVPHGSNTFNGLWSLDGRWLAYQTGDVFDIARSLFLQREDALPRQMTQPPFIVVDGLAFSPDSTRLIFTGMPPEQDQNVVVPPVEVYLLDFEAISATAEPELIALTDGIGHSSAPVWSPDGRQIAFVLFRESGNTLYRIDIAVGQPDDLPAPMPAEPQPLMPGVFADVSSPSWSPNGAQLAFIGSTGGTPDVYTLELVTGDIHRLTASLARESSPVWRSAPVR